MMFRLLVDSRYSLGLRWPALKASARPQNLDGFRSRAETRTYAQYATLIYSNFRSKVEFAASGFGPRCH